MRQPRERPYVTMSAMTGLGPRQGRFMLDWLPFQEPIVAKIVAAAGALLVLTIVVWFWQRRREAALAARCRKELQRTHDQLQQQQREISELAAQVIATGSTAVIAGFQVVRQIETLFTEGQRSPAEAVEALKALAARQGANAIINLNSQRLPNGKCTASGDAVIVRPLAGNAPDVPAAEIKRGNGEPRLDRRWD
ncbi:MAG: hypothetical protein KBH81_15480 [Phycisphaerae bacterium]|nr:hypothetical protein [Phycisphaerae bacterium]